MQTLAIDIETFSSVDLIETGVYRYVEAPDFGILLFAYAFDDDPVEIFDLAPSLNTGQQSLFKPKRKRLERLPDFILDALIDPNVIKTAYNAAFERVCISKHIKKSLPIDQWDCTMARALRMGLPGSLAQTSKALNLKEQKMDEGRVLISYFSIPCKPTRSNGLKNRNYPEDAPARWELFKAYCKQDVETERAVRKNLESFYTPELEKHLYILDQEINDRGVSIDKLMVENAIRFDQVNKECLETEMRELTGVDNPNSLAQLKSMLKAHTGKDYPSLDKESVTNIVEGCADPLVKRLLELRMELGKTSTSKYEAMKRCCCRDGRVRGFLQYYGANRTGRWAGRNIQVHNLPKNYIKDLEYARQTVIDGDLKYFNMLFGSVSDTLSQLVRTAFIPSAGCRFIIADFSAIEARVIAWLAMEQWRLDVFTGHGKIYEASAAQMFHVPIESITKGSALRQKGKIAELALGYGGGKGALIKMGALREGLSEDELPELVDTWRAANTKITYLWSLVENAAKTAINHGSARIPRGIKFIYEGNVLYAILPSKRRLAYQKARIGQSINNAQNSNALLYEGVNQTTKRWEIDDTYGGKLVENLVQAIARDCLAEAMLRLRNAGYNIVFHVHDEVILDTPLGFGSVEDACRIMGEPLEWAPGLLLRADGYETPFYKKD